MADLKNLRAKHFHQHESYDGRGYPGGLESEEIPIALGSSPMVSYCPYRQGMAPQEAEHRLLEASGTQFDSAVVKSFLPIARVVVSAAFAAAGTSVWAVL